MYKNQISPYHVQMYKNQMKIGTRYIIRILIPHQQTIKNLLGIGVDPLQPITVAQTLTLLTLTLLLLRQYPSTRNTQPKRDSLSTLRLLVLDSYSLFSCLNHYNFHLIFHLYSCTVFINVHQELTCLSFHLESSPDKELPQIDP